jgi:catechol 2,3-dioxygenase-like lactoylglutathione lyase family enzyme
MRAISLFIAGALVGVAATGLAQNQGPNRGVVGLNHVAISVTDVDKTVEYYTKVMGYPEAFRIKNAAGEIALVYVQISQNTFIEIQPANAQRPPGINHFGVVVDNMATAAEMFKARGANVGPVSAGGSKSINANIVDPNGIRTEFSELPADSFQKQAMDRWK